MLMPSPTFPDFARIALAQYGKFLQTYDPSGPPPREFKPIPPQLLELLAGTLALIHQQVDKTQDAIGPYRPEDALPPEYIVDAMRTGLIDRLHEVVTDIEAMRVIPPVSQPAPLWDGETERRQTQAA